MEEESREIRESVVWERERTGREEDGRRWRNYKTRLLVKSIQAFAQLVFVRGTEDRGRNSDFILRSPRFQPITILSHPPASHPPTEAGWTRRAVLLSLNSFLYVASTVPPWYLVGPATHPPQQRCRHLDSHLAAGLVITTNITVYVFFGWSSSYKWEPKSEWESKTGYCRVDGVKLLWGLGGSIRMRL
ncbi:hypothetical protein DFP72DRAFT_194555 [Ephemerocybe angulata]|uniref:Uncharacterized protein n=1 Tax=Ephemerocybe angulata TaxID=980116 RepID=A0A8H6I4E3_9AGAR|nr:hypothetical protein DFP72DRAFT_194555 [Tulosesus angulatus]